MAVTAAMVKDLRERSGAGMVDCKNALVATDGDMDKAIDYLREKGLAAAQKKSGRLASEGLAYALINEDNSVGVVVEVNIETDFAAKNQDFRDYVDAVARQAMNSGAGDMDAFLAEKWAADNSVTVKEALSQKIAIIGENINIRRFERYVKAQKGMLVSYIHGGGRVAVLIELACENGGDALLEAGKNVCMQIAAMSPQFIATTDVSDEFMQKERDILIAQAKNDEKNANKPDNIIAKMIEGRLKKEMTDFCLLEQEYVKDSEMNVAGYLKSVGDKLGAPVTVKRFARYETGEGLEKKCENFAEEVSKAMNIG